MREHGYESEARYYKRKRETLGNARGATGLVDEARLQVFQGLYLLRTAEARVPKSDLKESPRTKSNLLRLAGDLNAAISTLVVELKASNDPVRNLRFLRAILILTVEAERWDEALRYADELIAAGERDAALFLTRDECAQHAGWPPAQRIAVLRDSVEEYNRWDIETQVRWAELALGEGYFERAADALNRADEIARQDLGIMERERIRGTVKDKGELKRFEGKVTRLMRGDEGYVGVKGLSRDLYFRVGPDLRGQFKVGDTISFGIAWRIRGLRGIDVKKA
jgi:tetratricopeptide (TPR) repeat protein